MLKKTTNRKVSNIKKKGQSILKKEEQKPYYGSLSDLKKKGQSILKKEAPIIKKKEAPKPSYSSLSDAKKAPTPKPSFVISSNITKRRGSTIGSIMRRK